MEDLTDEGRRRWRVKDKREERARQRKGNTKQGKNLEEGRIGEKNAKGGEKELVSEGRRRRMKDRKEGGVRKRDRSTGKEEEK